MQPTEPDRQLQISLQNIFSSESFHVLFPGCFLLKQAFEDSIKLSLNCLMSEFYNPFGTIVNPTLRIGLSIRLSVCPQKNASYMRASSLHASNTKLFVPADSFLLFWKQHPYYGTKQEVKGFLGIFFYQPVHRIPTPILLFFITRPSVNTLLKFCEYMALRECE